MCKGYSIVSIANFLCFIKSCDSYLRYALNIALHKDLKNEDLHQLYQCTDAANFFTFLADLI